MKVFNNIQKLIIKGGVNSTIKDDGEIIGALIVKQLENTLTIEGEKSGMSFNSVGMSFNSGGISIGQNSCIISNHYNSNLIINGVKIDTTKLNEIADKDNSDPEQKYMLSSTCSINSINIKGSINLKPIPLIFVNNEIFNVNKAGSGDVKLPENKKFQSVIINIKGSGDVSGYDTETQIGVINIVGSGDVKGLHIRENGVISIIGSGDAYITADDYNTITTNKMGSGSIKVQRKYF